MCDATSALTMQGAGVGMSTVGAFYSAKGQQTALKSSAALADINARMAELSAQSSLVAGQRKEQASRLNTAKLKGSQKASLAANGIDVSAAGADTTVNNILTTTDVLGEVDANQIKANSIQEAFGYRMEATNYTNQALMARAGAKGVSPFMSAGSSLLTGASQIATTKYLYTKAGIK